MFFERRKVHDKEFTKDKLKNIPNIAANWPLVERLTIWIAAGKPADSSALTSDAMTKATNDAPDILAGLVEAFEDLPKSVGDNWRDRSAVEANVRTLFSKWTQLPPDGEAQEEVAALSNTDLDLIHPEDAWNNPSLPRGWWSTARLASAGNIPAHHGWGNHRDRTYVVPAGLAKIGEGRRHSARPTEDQDSDGAPDWQ